MISHVDIIGALVYRTREALNKADGTTDTSFYANAKSHYKYYNVLFDKPNKMHLWHFAGTQNEVMETINQIGKSDLASLKTFPCVFNFQSVSETHGVGKDGLVQYDFDLAIAAPVDSKWTTEQRNRTVHKYVLEPIYDEFMRQVRKCGWFQIPLNGVDFNRMKVFTTGTSFHEALRTQYGWYMDTIQMTNLRLRLNKVICDADVELIESEAEKVTDSILFKK